MPGPPSAKSKQQVVYHTCAKKHGSYDVDELTPDYYTNLETQESKCGLDERRKVIATTMLPYAAICKLEMRAANGSTLLGRVGSATTIDSIPLAIVSLASLLKFLWVGAGPVGCRRSRDRASR